MKASCTSFENMLATLNAEGIHTKDALIGFPSLYTQFWFTASEFVTYALRSKTGKKSSSGEIGCGNASKIEILICRGAVSKEDIHAECLMKILSKLDLILAQPLEKQKNYAYTICNNLINDHFRKLPAENVTIVSLQETVKGSRSNDDHTRTYADLVGDETYSGERVLLEKEARNELQQQKRDQLIREISMLCKKPAEVLVHIACGYFHMTPRALAALILKNGAASTYSALLVCIAKRYKISAKTLRTLIADRSFTASSIKADTQDADQIAAQVSRLVYRAKHKLHA